ncbi:MAG: hypothetical protein ACYCQI_11230 [Gammaproteobacteria bacterium]
MLRRAVGLKEKIKEDTIILVSKEELLWHVTANTKRNFKNDEEYQKVQVKLIYEAILKGASLDEIKAAVGENDRNFKSIMNSVKSEAASLHISEMDRKTLITILMEWDRENQPLKPRRLKTKIDVSKDSKSISERSPVAVVPIKEVDFLTGTTVVAQKSKEQTILPSDFMSFLSGVKQEVVREADLFDGLSPTNKI